MFGHGWPVEPGGCVFGAGFGVVVVVLDGAVAVLVVDWVGWVVLVVELGAAAAPAIPASAPPAARAPTTSPTRMMPARFIREPPMVVEGLTPTILGSLPKPGGTRA
jgi:hypothetical protein